MVELIIAKLRMNRAYGLTGFYYTKKDGTQDYKVIVTEKDKGYYQALNDVEAQLVDNDIVEVVKCRDCRFNCGDACLHALGLSGIETPDCYCSYGERRKPDEH